MAEKVHGYCAIAFDCLVSVADVDVDANPRLAYFPTCYHAIKNYTVQYIFYTDWYKLQGRKLAVQ
jgi:hypothetical protein